MKKTISLVVCAVCVLLGMTEGIHSVRARSPMPSTPCEPHTFLQKYLRFSQKDLQKLEQGKVTAKIPNMGVKNEFATFGTVRVNVPKERLVDQFRDIVTFKQSSKVQAIGKFSTPPRPEDVRTLTLESDDLQALKNCTPGDCKVKLFSGMMKRFRQEVDWSSSDYEQKANALMQHFLVDYVKDYLERGDAALGEYQDKKQPLRIADAFSGLLRDSSYLQEYAPELYTYLQDFPHGQLAHVENFIYWSKEKFGLKPTISLTHVTIYTQERENSNNVFITSKQLYANHYFETSLGFTAFMDEVGCEGPPDSYLMHLNRSRFDQLQGKIRKMVFAFAKGRVKKDVKKYLTLVKERLEADSL